MQLKCAGRNYVYIMYKIIWGLLDCMFITNRVKISHCYSYHGEKRCIKQNLSP